MIQTLNEFTCYKTYQALRLHFQGKMDFFKYGTIKAKASTYSNRKDRYFFQKLAKKYKHDELVNLLVANFIYSDISWVGEVLDESAEEVYLKWQQKIQSLSYRFERECSDIVNYLDLKGLDFTDLFVVKDNQFPKISNLYLNDTVSIETLILLNSCISLKKADGTTEKFREMLKPSFKLLPSGADNLYNIMVRYEPFLKFDKAKIQTVVRKFK